MTARNARFRLALLTLVLLASTTVSACGGETSNTLRDRPNAAAHAGPESTPARNEGRDPHRHAQDGDGDNDSGGEGPYDADDYAILRAGHAADSNDTVAVRTLLTHYYKVAAVDDGAGVCRLLYVLIAESLAEEEAAQSGRPARSGGRACASRVAKLLLRNHRPLALDGARLHLTELRIEGERGLALLGRGAMPEDVIVVHREGAAWRMYTLFDAGMP